jgi:hypothetical protein
MINKSIVPVWMDKSKRFGLDVHEVINAYSFVEQYWYERTPMTEHFKQPYDAKVESDLENYCKGLAWSREIEQDLLDKFNYMKGKLFIP